MPRCEWNECPDGKPKRRVFKYAPGCEACRERRTAKMQRYRRGRLVAQEEDELDDPMYSELGDYIIRRDASGELLPPEPKPGRPAFVEVTLAD